MASVAASKPPSEVRGLDPAAIDRINPSLFFGAGLPDGGQDLDKLVRDTLHRYDAALIGHGFGDYLMGRFRTAVFNMIPALRSLGLDLRNRTMVEIGCGKGIKGLAWADLVGRYVGIDVSQPEIAAGQTLRKSLGRDPGELILADASDVVKRPRDFGLDGVDVLVLYAVLEHLTPEERSAVLHLATDCYQRGAVVLIAESPNRLYPFDHHSSFMHFAQMLPDSLARRYIRRSPNEQMHRFVTGVEPANEEMMLYRSGRALSYHDFELDFYEHPSELVAPIDGYHPTFLNQQPLVRAEVELQRYFDDNRLDVPRLFSRAWIDGFLWKGGAGKPACRSIRHVMPPAARGWSLESRREFWALDRCIASGRRGEIGFPAGSVPRGSGRCQLLIDGGQPEWGLEVSIGGRTVLSHTVAELTAMRPPTWNTQFAVPLPVDRCEGDIVVRGLRTGGAAVINGLLIDVA